MLQGRENDEKIHQTEVDVKKLIHLDIGGVDLDQMV